MLPSVLFVCVENSCRSQMAEGFAKLHGQGVVEAWSAGSSPSGRINPLAIEVMREKGISLDGHLSKGLHHLPERKWDYVFTMGCGDACPIVPSVLKEDWRIRDPKSLPISEFRDVRDDIEKRVINFLNRFKKGASHV